MKPVCDFINAEAARLRNQSIAIGVASAIGAVVLPLLTGIGDPRIPLVLATGIVIFTIVKSRTEFTTSCARIAVKRIIAALSRQLAYKPSSSLTQQQFVAMDLFPGRVERFRSRDEISGRVGGTRYTLHHVHVAGAARGAAIFDGVVVKIEFAEPFPGHTVVIPDTSATDAPIGPGARVKKDLVFLKNPVFEQSFSVYASDYYEQFYQYAEALIEKGLAYVDSSNEEEIRQNRGSLGVHVLEIGQEGLIEGIEFADVFDTDAARQPIEAVERAVVQPFGHRLHQWHPLVTRDMHTLLAQLVEESKKHWRV